MDSLQATRPDVTRPEAGRGETGSVTASCTPTSSSGNRELPRRKLRRNAFREKGNLAVLQGNQRQWWDGLASTSVNLSRKPLGTSLFRRGLCPRHGEPQRERSVELRLELTKVT